MKKAILLLAFVAMLVGSLLKIPCASADPDPRIDDPRIESTGADGTVKNEFLLGENVYVKGQVLMKGISYEIYVIPHEKVVPGMTLRGENVTPTTFVTSIEGGVIPVTLVWPATLTYGYYDIIADRLGFGEGIYNPLIDPADRWDLVDGVLVQGGFFVVTEFGAIIAVVACYAATFAVMMFKRKRAPVFLHPITVRPVKNPPTNY